VEESDASLDNVPGHEINDPSDDVQVDGYMSEELHTPPPSDNEDERGKGPSFPQFNEEAEFGTVVLSIGMEFKNLQLFKAALKDYTIHLGREIKMVKNDNRRVRAKCANLDCNWEIYCASSSITNSYQIKIFREEYTCPREVKNKAAHTDWVSQKLLKRLRGQPGLSHSEAYYLMKDEYSVILDTSKYTEV